MWAGLAIINLCITALLGTALRTKFLFPVPLINYRNVLSAHSHFAFGGWVTLALMILFIYFVLPEELRKKKSYQISLWGIELTSLGMAVSFPFSGYAFFSTSFSTLFLFSTYLFAFIFTRDILNSALHKAVKLLSVTAVVCLVISSVGPWMLAYILASKSTDSILYRDSVYTFLHFQYNGFFTLSVFAIYFQAYIDRFSEKEKKTAFQFAALLSISIPFSLALALLWHPHAPLIELSAAIGCILIFLSLLWFLMLRRQMFNKSFFKFSFGKFLWMLAMLSFLIKIVLQTGTIIPELGKAVFGLRPIIIGFLHLVFLGLISFFIFSRFVECGILNIRDWFNRFALSFFIVAVVLNEAVLAVQGFMLLGGMASSLFSWILWGVAILLFLSSFTVILAKIRSDKGFKRTRN